MSISHKNKTLNGRRLARSRGFTLLEVMMAIAILSILTGVLFSMVRVTMETVADFSQLQTRQQQVSGLLELCRSTFRSLPNSAILEGRIREEEGKYLSWSLASSGRNVFCFVDT
jgi:prepilin-type N-terminal cleavage/methylation domain-containing protein